MNRASDVTAIVVTHDSEAKIAACLDALAAEGVASIVVDNASGDATRAIAEGRGACVIASPLNEGYGRGNNLGVDAAATRFVLICNPDVTVEPGAVQVLLAAALQFPEAGLWAPLIIEPDGRRFVQARSLLSPPHLNQSRKALIPEGPASIPFVSGACFLIERDMLRRLGGFDPEIFLFYEDDDLCRRLMDMGAAPVLEPRAVVAHQRGTSSSASAERRFKTRWHMAWSERHVRRKYGLEPAKGWPVAWNALRAVLNAVVLRKMAAARYAGTVAGAAAFVTGRSALQREGLS
jgi:N-acetylglucosaminyl-diphospho-decaprenol L-rhamnosyltransferase